MKILVTASFFYPHKGGSQQYALELSRALMKCDRNAQVDVVCYNTDNAPEKEEYEGLTIYRVPCMQILPGQFAVPNYIALYKLLKQLTRETKYDVVNTHNRFFECAWWTPLLAKKIGAISILTDHCANHPYHPSKLVVAIAKVVDMLWVPLIARLYDMVAVTNKATYRFIKSLGVKKPVLIYGGVDTSYFSPKPKRKKRILPGIERTFTEKEIIVTFVGRMIHSKGPQLLFEAAKTILRENKRVHVVFVGGGEMYDELEPQKTDRMYFVGAFTKDKIAEVFTHTDIVVHPSLHSEGFPNVILEAGASGCAVIATNMGGTNEMITHNKSGLFIKPNAKHIATALRDLIRNKYKREHFGKMLRKKIEQEYDWKIIAKIYSTVLYSKIKPHTYIARLIAD
jgi:glycosyltransferase involved in cell wall biosynthesis